MLPRLPSKPSICNIATKYCSTLDRVGNQWFKGITFIFCIAALWNVMQGAYNSQQNTTNEFQLIDKPHIVIVEEQQKSKYSRASATAGESKPVAIESRPSGLDFAVAGFPKTGTTYLLRLLESHPEIVMPSEEFCEIQRGDGDVRTMDLLRSSYSLQAKSTLPLKYGIKCPAIVRNINMIDTLVKMSKDTRLVIGLRHPILWFQSFFNYRVLEHHRYNWEEKIPSPYDLTNGTLHWRGVSTAFTRFDLYLKQLAKVAIDRDELIEMQKSNLLPRDNPLKIFIYIDEQLKGNDTERYAHFRRDLQEFLGMTTPINNFKKLANVNSKKYPEYMDICEDRYDDIRSQILQRGIISSQWINEKFIESSDVIVSNKDHFKALLRTWGEDPCPSVQPMADGWLGKRQIKTPKKESSFVKQFSLALGGSDELISLPFGTHAVPFIVLYGKLYCRRSHKHQILHHPRTRSFIGMVSSVLDSHRHWDLTVNIGKGSNLTTGLPILLFAGDNNGCDITKRLDQFDYPRLTWSIPSPMKYGAEWCNAIPTLSTVFWGVSQPSWNETFALHSSNYQWSSKINKAVWRGSTTYYNLAYRGSALNATPRGRLVQKSIENPELIDAGFTKFNHQYASREKELSNYTILTKHMEFDEQMNYKAILDIDGNSWSSRFPKLLCTNSVVIKIEPDYVEYFYDELTPMMHYVPASLGNITEVVTYVLDEDNEAEMKSIVRSANTWCSQKMTKEQLVEDAMLGLKMYEEAVRENVQNGTIRISDDVDFVLASTATV